MLNALAFNFFYSEENLRAALGKMGVRDDALRDVIEKAKSRHYQVINSLILIKVNTWLWTINYLPGSDALF